MSRHHPGRRRQSLSSSGVGIGVAGAFVSSPMAASTAAAALAYLRVAYTYTEAAYMNYSQGEIQYSCCTLDGTTESAAEAEAAAALTSSDLEKKFRSNYEKTGKGEGEDTHFSFFPLSLAATMR